MPPKKATQSKENSSIFAVGSAINEILDLLRQQQHLIQQVQQQQLLLQHQQQGVNQSVNFKSFQNVKPPEFKGETDPVTAGAWLKEMEKAFNLVQSALTKSSRLGRLYQSVSNVVKGMVECAKQPLNVSGVDKKDTMRQSVKWKIQESQVIIVERAMIDYQKKIVMFMEVNIKRLHSHNNQNWRNSFVGLRWENGDWGTLFRSSFEKVSDGSLKSIHLSPEETIIYNELTRDDGTTTSWTLLEEFSLIHVGLSFISQHAAKEINEDNVPLVEETARMKKACLAGLDTRGKATELIFLRKHKEPMGEASVEGAEGHSAPITAAAPAIAATGAFHPLWGFHRGDTVVGSTKYARDWSYHGVTPKDFTDVVVTPDLERIKLMGAQSLASSNAYFQDAVRQAESWKRASDKVDNALRRQQKKYAALEKKFKRKEEELGESNAELVVLRAEKDKAIDNYLDSEEFAQSMRIRDDSVFPKFFRTGWDTTHGTVNEACPNINPADYVCPDDEALLQRFHTRVVVSDYVPQDPLLPPPESSSRPVKDDSSSSPSEMTETSSESGGEGMTIWMPRAPQLLRAFPALRGLFTSSYFRDFIYQTLVIFIRSILFIGFYACISRI
ncbi:hypothetical protein AgCh_000546 [Apium graveolens]